MELSSVSAGYDNTNRVIKYRVARHFIRPLHSPLTEDSLAELIHAPSVPLQQKDTSVR